MDPEREFEAIARRERSDLEQLAGEPSLPEGRAERALRERIARDTGAAQASPPRGAPTAPARPHWGWAAAAALLAALIGGLWFAAREPAASPDDGPVLGAKFELRAEHNDDARRSLRALWIDTKSTRLPEAGVRTRFSVRRHPEVAHEGPLLEREIEGLRWELSTTQASSLPAAVRVVAEVYVGFGGAQQPEIVELVLSSP